MTAHPDANLLDLGRRHAAIAREADALAEAAIRAFELAEAQWPPKPDALRVRGDDWFVPLRGEKLGPFYSTDQVARWRASIVRNEANAQDLLAAQRARYLTRGREIVTAWDTYAGACAAINVAIGARVAEAEADAAGLALYALERRIFAITAATPEGWRIKASIAAQMLGEDPDGTYEDALVRNLLADLLAGSVTETA